jgi:hypothetical protein
MQKRNDNNCQKKNIARFDPTYTYLTRLDPTFDVQTRPTMSEIAQLLYNTHERFNGPASAEEAPITAHHNNCMNCSSDNPKTLINARKRS